jgi:NADH-quinone oxidoreductase subunit F
MTFPSDTELIARWKQEPAPLLPILHAFHDRDGYLSDEALGEIAMNLRIPLADLFGTVTFYHHFSREPGGLEAPRVCTGPICKMNGADALLDGLLGAIPMPCAGRCDDPVPVLRGNETLVGISPDSLEARPSPVPPPPPTEVEECVLYGVRGRERASLDGYQNGGGYDALREIMAPGRGSEELVELVTDSGLLGKGRDGSPTGAKWKAVASAPGNPKTIVCNATEGEPGCFKDRCILDHDPHAVIEGMTLAAFATGASRGFIYLRYEYPETEKALDGAITAAYEAGLLGEGILGTQFTFDLFLRRGAGGYICGEETSLLNSLEGKHPIPRNRPPFPVTHGFEGSPTVVNNVETLASVPPIVRLGPRWYRSLGRGDHAGTRVISLSGDVTRPGNYEVPVGLPLQELIHEWAGGPGEGRTVQAVTMAGLSGGFLAGADLDVTLDEPSVRAKGSFLGAGGIMVFDDTRNMVEVSRQAMSFFAHESCGKCLPCRIGTRRLAELLAGTAGAKESAPWIDEVVDLGRTMVETSLCGLGTSAPLITESLLRYFPEQVAAHVED